MGKWVATGAKSLPTSTFTHKFLKRRSRIHDKRKRKPDQDSPKSEKETNEMLETRFMIASKQDVPIVRTNRAKNEAKFGREFLDIS